MSISTALRIGNSNMECITQSSSIFRLIVGIDPRVEATSENSVSQTAWQGLAEWVYAGISRRVIALNSQQANLFLNSFIQNGGCLI